MFEPMKCVAVKRVRCWHCKRFGHSKLSCSGNNTYRERIPITSVSLFLTDNENITSKEVNPYKYRMEKEITYEERMIEKYSVGWFLFVEDTEDDSALAKYLRRKYNAMEDLFDWQHLEKDINLQLELLQIEVMFGNK